MLTWQPCSVDGDPHEPEWRGDPADLIDAMATLLLAMQRPAWMRQAACKGMDPSVFFPPRGATSKRACEVCEPCPVRAECRSFALEHDEVGVWAGQNVATRRAMRRKAS